MRAKTLIMLVGALAVGGVGGWQLSWHLAPPAQSTGTCLTQETTAHYCRFVGAPLEMAGTPVYIDGFQQPFLPTRDAVEFIDAAGLTWNAPPKTLTDGATIPQLFAPLLGDRQSREFLIAAALHDAYCGVGNEGLNTFQVRPWEEVHLMFYEALLAGGTSPKRARIMYAAVYLGGPRWDDPARSLEGVPPEVLLQEMAWCLEWMLATDPSLEDILAWMREREPDLISGTNTAPQYDRADPRNL